jgi:hypothetical protein
VSLPNLLGKNILNGNINPSKLTPISPIKGLSNTDYADFGSARLKKIQAVKNTGTNQSECHAHL